MVYSCAGSSDLFVMTSNFSCAGAFSTLHSSTLWRIDTIIFTTSKKLSSLSTHPPPHPTNVLEINKPAGGGGGFIDDCSIKYRSNDFTRFLRSKFAIGGTKQERRWRPRMSRFSRFRSSLLVDESKSYFNNELNIPLQWRSNYWWYPEEAGLQCLLS